MKKIMLSLLLIGALSTALQASCYEQWLKDYKTASDQLSSDVLYCRYERPVIEIFRLTGTCNRWAYMDFNDSIEVASDNYARCIRR